MLFNSIEFIIFLPIVFAIYWLLAKRLWVQNLFVVIVSYIFYGWWEWRFLCLIAFTTLCSYVLGMWIGYELSNLKYKKAKLLCICNIIINVFILALFKYYNFFVISFSDLCHSLGWNIDVLTLNLILPVGISFYTFQALSYTIDVYKKKITPTTDIIAFFAFICFFPQLVAGPIERATNLLPQFLAPRRFDYIYAVDGCRQMLWGFFKKMVIADNCAFFVSKIFADYQNMSSLTLLIGGILFSFQIYGDFSGYSDIAIGCSRLFGVNLKTNFNFPYFSRDIAEFWRRWHISLNTWFRDYIYIPLGGSRVCLLKVIRNTWIIFLVSGLWHGANWTYIIWGIWHALLFMPLLIRKKNRKYLDVVAKGRSLPTFQELFQMITTFILVMFAWIIFRSETISDAYDYIMRIFSPAVSLGIASFIPSQRFYMLILFLIFMIILEWKNREYLHGLCIMNKYVWIRYVEYCILFYLILSFGGAQTEFIYFQF